MRPLLLSIILRAFRVALESQGKTTLIHEHVKACAAAALEEVKAGQQGWIQQRTAGEILSMALAQPSRDRAAVLLDYLTPEQRSDLKVLLHDQISDKPVIYLRMNHEPEEPHRWLFWYLYHSEMAHPKNKRAMGGIPMYVLAIRRGAVRTNKAKEIVFPLAPMYAHVYKALGPELKKWGYQIKHPKSVNRIANSLRVSHDTAKAWLEKDIPVKIQRNGKGGVDFRFTLETIVRCIELVAGKKRGRKPKQS
jgi:hypothetical protein